MVWSRDHSCAPILNGLDHARISYNDEHWISQNLHFKRTELLSFLGFIGATIQEKVKEDFPNEINVNKLIHPHVWLAATSKYLALASLFPKWLSLSVEESLELGTNYLAFMSYLRKAPKLHEKLIKEYTDKLASVKYEWERALSMEAIRPAVEALDTRYKAGMKVQWPEHASYSSPLQLTDQIDDFYKNYQVELEMYVEMEKSLFKSVEDLTIAKLINGELTIQEAAATLSSPLYCLAHHSTTLNDNDWFGIRYITAARTNAHIINIANTMQGFGFDFPLWIKPVFENKEVNFPRELYLAERLGLIHFEYEFRAASQNEKLQFSFNIYLQKGSEPRLHYGTIYYEVQSVEKMLQSSEMKATIDKMVAFYQRYHIVTPSGPLCGYVDPRYWSAALFYRIFVGLHSFKLSPLAVYLKEVDQVNNNQFAICVDKEIQNKIEKLKEDTLSLQLSKSNKMQAVQKAESSLDASYYLLVTVLKLIQNEDSRLEKHLSGLWNAEKLTNYWKSVVGQPVFPKNYLGEEQSQQMNNILSIIAEVQEVSDIEQAIAALRWSVAVSSPEQMNVLLKHEDREWNEIANQVVFLNSKESVLMFDTCNEGALNLASNPSPSSSWIGMLYQGVSDYGSTLVSLVSHFGKQKEGVALPCVAGMLNESPVLKCTSEEGTFLVYPKSDLHNNDLQRWHNQNELPTPSDAYDLNSCQYIEHNGQPSVHCEGERTTISYFHQRRQSSLAIEMGSQIALGVVVFRIGKDVIDWVKNSLIVNEEKGDSTRYASHQTLIEECDEMENALQAVSMRVKANQKQPWMKIFLEDHLEMVRELREMKKVLKTDLLEVSETIRCFTEEANDDFCDIQTLRNTCFSEFNQLPENVFFEQRKMIFSLPQNLQPRLGSSNGGELENTILRLKKIN